MQNTIFNTICRVVFIGLMLLVPATLKANECHLESRQLIVHRDHTPAGPGSITIAFILCDSDPFAPCDEPVPGGCGRAIARKTLKVWW